MKLDVESGLAYPSNIEELSAKTAQVMILVTF